jgi:hypothetical protein
MLNPNKDMSASEMYRKIRNVPIWRMGCNPIKGLWKVWRYVKTWNGLLLSPTHDTASMYALDSKTYVGLVLE